MVFCINSHTGKMVGIIFFMFVLNLRHRKYTLVIAVFFQGSSYVLYQITSNIYLLNFAKMFASGTKVCGTLYRSIGIEQFGLSKYKSVFFSLVQVVSTYGQIIGFTLSSLLFKRNWRMGLLFILVLIYIIDFGFLLVPGKYFFRSYSLYNSNDDSQSDACSTNDDSGDKLKRMDSLFIDEKKGEKKEEEIKENKDEKIWDKIKKFFKDVLSLVKNIIFILSLLKRSIVYFILQIVQSYLKQYQQHNFENADEDLIVLFYSIATLASTALGGLMSGIITKKLGGYENICNYNSRNNNWNYSSFFNFHKKFLCL